MSPRSPYREPGTVGPDLVLRHDRNTVWRRVWRSACDAMEGSWAGFIIFVMYTVLLALIALD